MFGFKKYFIKENNYYTQSNIVEYIQIDHTSKCNLLCSQCGRVGEDGKVLKTLPMTELKLEDYERVFTLENFPNLKRVFFCGNYGDAIASDTFIPAVVHLKSIGIDRIDLVTNGSLRDESWWSALASKLNGPSDMVAFSIDGLEDTNHLYRINSNWNKIMKNASAFIKAGGKARWDMLVFEHNEHQIEATKKLATEMGFAKFTVKKTNRFIDACNLKKNDYRETSIKKPKNKDHQGTFHDDLETIKSEFKSWDNYVEKTEIACQFQKNGNGLFLDFECNLWPCTWVAAMSYTPASEKSRATLIELRKRYGATFNSLKENSLKKVLDNKWFKNELVKSWDLNGKRKLPECAMHCGQVSYTSSSSDNRKTLELK